MLVRTERFTYRSSRNLIGAIIVTFGAALMAAVFIALSVAIDVWGKSPVAFVLMHVVPLFMVYQSVSIWVLYLRGYVEVEGGNLIRIRDMRTETQIPAGDIAYVKRIESKHGPVGVRVKTVHGKLFWIYARIDGFDRLYEILGSIKPIGRTLFTW